MKKVLLVFGVRLVLLQARLLLLVLPQALVLLPRLAQLLVQPLRPPRCPQPADHR
jgi:hypothetical protein